MTTYNDATKKLIEILGTTRKEIAYHVAILMDRFPSCFFEITEYNSNSTVKDGVYVGLLTKKELMEVLTEFAIRFPLKFLFLENDEAVTNNLPPLQTDLYKEVGKEGYAEVIKYLRRDRKIDSIKAYRRLTNLGLKESKNFIDALQEELRWYS